MPLDLQTKKLVDCIICGRRFDESRIFDHQDICKRAARVRRKPFDSFKQRVRGTVMESHLDKIKMRLHAQNGAKMQHGDWRKAHEEFVMAIKAAKRSRPTKVDAGKTNKCSSTLLTFTTMHA